MTRMGFTELNWIRCSPEKSELDSEYFCFSQDLAWLCHNYWQFLDLAEVVLGACRGSVENLVLSRQGRDWTQSLHGTQSH